MKKIGFVIPWYGEKIPGGAEMELRGLTTHFHQSGVEVEIITTCVKDFNSDWNENFHKEGTEIIHGFPVRRFKVRKRDTIAFDKVNYKLINNMPVSPEDEQTYIREMVNSPDLCDYIKENQDDYSLFVFIPYMFGVTVNGLKVCPEKSILIPCFHNESYVYMNIFKPVFENIAGIIYLSKPEYNLANKVFNLSKVKQYVAGAGVNTELVSNKQDFIDKYNVDYPFILYAGRKDTGKNVHTLIQYFEEYKKRNSNKLKMILIGGGDIQVPDNMKKDIIDLGFIDLQDKYNAQGASLLLCQPSKNESFSLVIMESWLCKRPVMVHNDCAVTKNFAIESNGGLYFKDYFEFEGSLNYMLENPEKANIMGENGRDYVMDNFAWNVIVDKYMKFFKEVAGEI